MNRKDLYRGIGEIDDALLERSETTAKKSKRPAWIKWSAMAACLCLVVMAAVVIPNTLTSTSPAGSSTTTGNITEEGDRDVDMTSEELTSVMLDVGYTQAEVDEYQSFGYQMTWAKWWMFFHSIDDNGGDFTLDALKTFSQEELPINTGDMPGGAYVGDDNEALDDIKMSSQNDGVSGYTEETPATTVNGDFIEQEK